MIYYLILLVLFSSFILRKDWLKKMKYILIWGGIFLSLFVVISYKDLLLNNRVVASFLPGVAIVENGKISFVRAEDQHFYINILVNGRKVKFLVDTGASDIVLNANDAKKVGIDVGNIVFDKVFYTANGKTRGASVALGSFKLSDDVVFNDIRASVNEGELGVSLLGVRFLGLFRKYEFRGEVLSLYW